MMLAYAMGGWIPVFSALLAVPLCRPLPRRGVARFMSPVAPVEIGAAARPARWAKTMTEV